jgi:hypothetical protein
MCSQPSDSAVCSGVIGTGLFLSSANSLRHGGPVGLLLGYMLVGSICYSVMVSCGPSFTFPVLVRALININVTRSPLVKWCRIFPSLVVISS